MSAKIKFQFPDYTVVKAPFGLFKKHSEFINILFMDKTRKLSQVIIVTIPYHHFPYLLQFFVENEAYESSATPPPPAWEIECPLVNDDLLQSGVPAWAVDYANSIPTTELRPLIKSADYFMAQSLVDLLTAQLGLLTLGKAGKALKE